MQLMLYFQRFICEIQSHHLQIDCCDLAIPLGFQSNIMSPSHNKAYDSPHPRAIAYFDPAMIEERAQVKRERQEQINSKRAELKKQKEQQLLALSRPSRNTRSSVRRGHAA